MNAQIDQFILESGYSPRTEETYTRYLNYALTWFSENGIQAASMGSQDVDQWISHNGWASGTKYLAWNALKSFLTHFYGTQHPACRYKVKREDPGPQRTLSVTETQQLLRGINTKSRSGKRDLPMIMLMLDSGLRASEVCRLLVDDVDMVNQAFQVKVKGGKWRRCFFSDETKVYLEAWLKIREPIARCGNLFIAMGGLHPGEALNRDGLRSIFHNLGRRLGIEGLSPHVMRRTMACTSARLGCPTVIIAKQGGWSSINLVQRYCQALDAEDFKPYFPISGVIKAPAGGNLEGTTPAGDNGGRFVNPVMEPPGGFEPSAYR